MYPIGKRQYKRQKRRHHFSQFEGELSVNVKNSEAELWFYNFFPIQIVISLQNCILGNFRVMKSNNKQRMSKELMV